MPGAGDDNNKSGFSAEYVQELRSENAGWRTKLRATEEELSKLQTEKAAITQKLSDLEGQVVSLVKEVSTVLGLDATKTELKELPDRIKEGITNNSVGTEKAKEALKKSVFISAAVKAGVRKEALEDAFKLADLSNVKVDFDTMSVFPVDAEGNQLKGQDSNPITGLDSVVGSLLKDKPYLMGKGIEIGSSSKPMEQTSEDDGVGTLLGKQAKETFKYQEDSQKHYFG